MQFQRGLDPLKALDIGKERALKDKILSLRIKYPVALEIWDALDEGREDPYWKTAFPLMDLSFPIIDIIEDDGLYISSYGYYEDRLEDPCGIVLWKWIQKGSGGEWLTEMEL